MHEPKRRAQQEMGENGERLDGQMLRAITNQSSRLELGQEPVEIRCDRSRVDTVALRDLPAASPRPVRSAAWSICVPTSGIA